MLTRHRDAFEAFAADKARGMDGYENHWRVVDTVRAQLAPMMGLAPEDIALIGNASEGIVKVLSSIEWRDGDNVVVSKRDYASGRYALASLGDKGVEIRTIPAR